MGWSGLLAGGEKWAVAQLICGGLELLQGERRPHAQPKSSKDPTDGEGQRMEDSLAKLDVVDCSDRNNSKYYVVVVQYTARFNAEAVKNFLYLLNEGKIAKKKFNFFLLYCIFQKVIVIVIGYALRLAPEDTSIELTGFEHNAVTCVGMKTDIPVILDEAIEKLNPDFFWLGGSEVDLKLGIRTSEFINFAKPFIVSCSSS
ncbi:hypothetical protein D8674_037650 [Pyrus ussuriensis x Pyrus communis]|uniref:YbaK/aminoacyl-tRNA synthetase-associated domain-containing protein n=1 Tax=Pyrus ussuriensis x Pyrus communis TaxID=2448454 RepID=A0A5N5H4G0_9ROSA|nr:hypothetical protein D8674_037650 [Pyrus ussuriensis x Pyrus communis]